MASSGPAPQSLEVFSFKCDRAQEELLELPHRRTSPTTRDRPRRISSSHRMQSACILPGSADLAAERTRT